MKNFIKRTLLAILIICIFNPLYAETTSSHTLNVANNTYVMKVAIREMDRLVLVKAIDKSWQTKPIVTVEKKAFNKNLEWVVAFQNKEIKDMNKQMLYIFVTINGVLIGSNYTGE